MQAETICFLIFIGLCILLYAGRRLYVYLTFEKQMVKKYLEGFGKKQTLLKDNRRDHIKGYYNKHKSDKCIDTITWNDLELDAVFEEVNFTHSAIGEEYLYYLLRENTFSTEEYERLETFVKALLEHPEERAQIEFIMGSLGYTERYSIYEYLDHLNILGKRSNLKHYLADFCLIISIILLPFWTNLGVILLIAFMIYNIMTYFTEKKLVEPYVISFVFALRMVAGAKRLSAMKEEWLQPITTPLKGLYQALRPMNYGFSVVQSVSSPLGGNPLEIFADYLKMIFHYDLILFNRLYKFLDAHKEQVDEMLGLMGQLEAYVSIAAYRTYLKDEYCIPDFLRKEDAKQIHIEDGYHPKMPDAVRNSIDASRGVLITGSNASGKSSFLKMIAVNAVLAQSIHTVTARCYKAPLFQIYSSMSLRDDLENGDSYFMVEIKAIKRIMDGVDEDRFVLCFVDEVLRGTNTIERIAASTQILKCLNQSGILCFAATHDIELTYLLEQDFDNYHFSEEIIEDDVVFQYKLLNGRATSRNAILLLKQMGYGNQITEAANSLVKLFEETGKWTK